MNLTPAEARHILNILIDYTTGNKNYLESTIDVLTNSEVTTADVMTKISLIATSTGESNGD